MYIIIFILVLGLVILIHEFGHFIFAKRAGILCYEFSIGMGPVIWQTRRGETVFSIRAIPIGGYVLMAGEDAEIDKLKTGANIRLDIKNNIITKIILKDVVYNEENIVEATVLEHDLYGKDGNSLFIKWKDQNGEEHFNKVASDAKYIMGKGKEYQIAPYNRCIESKGLLDRFLTIFMGAGMNFLLAIFLFFLAALIGGTATNSNIIGGVVDDSAAEAIGIESGDRIISIEGKEVNSWEEISSALDLEEDKVVTIVVERDGKEYTFDVIPKVYIATLGVSSNLDTETDTIIGDIGPNSKADKAGLLAGDRIVSINGATVSNWFEIETEMEKYLNGDEVTFKIDRNGQTLDKKIIVLKALDKETVADYFVGISAEVEHSLFKSIKNGFTATYGAIAGVFKTLKILFTNDNVGAGDLAGPVGIYDMTKTFAMGGFVSLLSWTAFLCANIGFINLLPLPALDGGRLIFILIEAITKKPVDRKIEGYIHMAGFIILLMFFLYVTGNDILRLIGIK